MYLFHWPIYQIIRKQTGISLTFTQFVVAMAFTLPITELSYRFVEMPIRQGRLGAWFRGEQRAARTTSSPVRRRLVLVVAAASAMLGFAGVSIAVARNVCVGDIECSIEIAEQAQAQAPAPVQTATSLPASADTSPTTQPSPPVTDMPSTPAAVDRNPQSGGTTTPSTLPQSVSPGITAPATTQPPVVTAPPIALGESVMLGAITNLQAGGFIVDAAKSRQGDDMAALVEALRAAGSDW